jgi:hypothetical protein
MANAAANDVLEELSRQRGGCLLSGTSRCCGAIHEDRPFRSPGHHKLVYYPCGREQPVNARASEDASMVLITMQFLMH